MKNRCSHILSPNYPSRLVILSEVKDLNVHFAEVAPGITSKTTTQPLLNRYNSRDIQEGAMAFDSSCWRRLGTTSLLFIAVAVSPHTFAQTLHVDTTPAHAVKFDPDKAMGTSMDILPAREFDKVYSEPIIKEGLSAGWGPITYRQNTELTYSAWHWNPDGTWSDEKNRSGYFVGNAQSKDFLRKSFGYHIAHRGTTRSDAGQNEFSRLTDGDDKSYWKSNPYLAEKFTIATDSTHPQWVVIEFGLPQEIDAIQIAWANPYAKKYVIEYWNGKEDALNKQTSGEWVRFPQGEVTAGKGGNKD